MNPAQSTCIMVAMPPQFYESILDLHSAEHQLKEKLRDKQTWLML
jgi:hypothetical protein